MSSPLSSTSSFPCELSATTGSVGNTIPCLGFGTANIKGDGAVEVMLAAINEGYRMLDTALLYGNQVEVGEAVKRSGVSRDDLWITTKVSFFPGGDDSLWMYNANNLVGDELESIDLSLQLLDMEFVDLCLLHNPCTSAVEYNVATLPHFFELFNECGYDSAVKPEKLPDGTILRDLIIDHKRKELATVDKLAAYESRKKSWKQLEYSLSQGKCKRIGVSNYTAALLLEMKEYATVMPSVNEVELHPRFYSSELVDVCRDLNITLIGYGTGHFLAIEQSREEKAKVKNGILEAITMRARKSRMQVVLRWMLQNGVVSIPRTGNTDHMRQNRDIFDFELTSEEMKQLDGLNENHPFYWDPVPTDMTIADKK